MSKLIIGISDLEVIRKAKTLKKLRMLINNDKEFQFQQFHGAFTRKEIDYDDSPQSTIDAMVKAVNLLNETLDLHEDEVLENIEKCSRFLEVIQKEETRNVLIETIRKVRGIVSNPEVSRLITVRPSM